MILRDFEEAAGWIQSLSTFGARLNVTTAHRPERHGPIEDATNIEIIDVQDLNRGLVNPFWTPEEIEESIINYRNSTI